MRIIALLVACLALPVFAQQSVTVSLTAAPENPSYNEWFLTITGTSSVQISANGTTRFDWVRYAPTDGGNLGTAVATTPTLGGDEDGVLFQAITLTGPISGARADFDGATFAGAQVTVNGVTQPLVQSGAVWSATFTTPEPPPPPVFTGGATLTWEAPTENTDGSPLLDLVGFKAYWGMTQGTYPNSVLINDPGLLTYRVESLAVGTWYFVVTALNAAGAESEFSDVASATIVDDTSPPPVDCVVNDPPWVLGTPQPTACPVSWTQTHTDTRTLTVLTQPENGGTVCPPLNETRTVSVTCTPPPTDPCVMRPFTFTVRSWPGGVTGARSLGYETNKRLRGLPTWGYNSTNTRIVSVTATDFEGCTRTVVRP